MKNAWVLKDAVVTISIYYKGEYLDVLIDEEDFDLINDFPNTWSIQRSKPNAPMYALGRIFNNKDGSPSERIRMHRLVMGLKSDDPRVIDHINGNSLDNRKENLRIVDHFENMSNMTRMSRNTTGVMGVSWSKSSNKWQAAFSYRGKRIFVGYFETIEEAKEAYDKRRKEIIKI